MPVDQLPEEFRTVANSLADGEVSAPFRTSFGVHIVRLEKRLPARTVSLEGDWPALEQYALNVKREDQFQTWVRTQMVDHYIWPEELQKLIVGE